MISVVSSIEDGASLANQRQLSRHLDIEVIGESEHAKRRRIPAWAPPGVELFTITITSSTAFNAMMGGFAAAAGAQLALLFGRAMDKAAEEFGKDVYTWAKASILGFIRDSKRKNVGAALEDDANCHAQVILDAPLFENTPHETGLRVYIPHTFGQWSRDERRLVNNQTPDELVLDRIGELSTVVLPFVSDVVQTAMRARNTSADHIVVTGVLPLDNAKPYRWDVIVSGIGSAIIESGPTLSHVNSHVPEVTEDDLRRLFETTRSRARPD